MAASPYSTKKNNKKKFILSIVFIVLLLFSATVIISFFVQENMIFNSEGFRFETLFRGRETEETEGNNTAYPPPVLDIEKTEEVIDTPEDVYTPPAALEQIHAGLLVTANNIPETLENIDETADVYALEVKPIDGRYLVPHDDFPTEEERSVSAVMSAMELPHKIAVTSVMQDDTLPRENQELALRTAKQVLWLDANNRTWFNPYVENIDVYCTNLLENCLKAGFNQLLLRDFQFCTKGRTDLVSYGETEDSGEARVTRITEIASVLFDAATEKDAVLSILLTETAVKELVDYDAGQDVKELAKYCHILYIPVNGSDLETLDLTELKEATKEENCLLGLYITGEGTVPENMDLHRIYVR